MKVNIFNRIMMVLSLLAAILALGLFLLLPEGLSYELAANFEFLGRLLEDYQIYSFSFSLNWFAFVLSGAIVLVVLVLILYLELRLPREKAARVFRTKGGEVEVATASIAQRLERRILSLGEILEVRPRVFPGHSAIDVLLKVTTTSEVNIPAKTEEICRVTRQVLEEEMGLKLRQVRLRLSHGPYAPAPIPAQEVVPKSEGRS